MRFIPAILVFACLSVGSQSLQAQTTTIYLVRHAEKKADDGRNPELNDVGKKRARTLARALRSVKLAACFSSNWKRTQHTAAPAAKLAGIDISTRTAGKEKLLAAEIRKDFAGKTVLFVGHSNTVPDLLRYLGVDKDKVPKLSEKHYDNLFQVRIAKDGTATMTQLHYGAADPI